MMRVELAADAVDRAIRVETARLTGWDPDQMTVRVTILRGQGGRAYATVTYRGDDPTTEETS